MVRSKVRAAQFWHLKLENLKTFRLNLDQNINRFVFVASKFVARYYSSILRIETIFFFMRSDLDLPVWGVTSFQNLFLFCFFLLLCLKRYKAKTLDSGLVLFLLPLMTLRTTGKITWNQILLWYFLFLQIHSRM